VPAFSDATQQDADAITMLHAEAAVDLTRRFGHGHWSHAVVVGRLDPPAPHGRVRVGREGDRVVSALRLQTKKPWAIDAAYFTVVRRPLYLTGMVVAIDRQRRGVGRAALDDALEIARAWPTDAIRLDAYDAAAGAGPFYARCGYTERGRVDFKGNRLIYYERLIRG
jgi:GNAT superfamily N-acetyltransferase